jgi:hypothetical protein
VRSAVLIVLVGGCFTASPVQGVPCDPLAPACPAGQSCVASPTGPVCSSFDGGFTPPNSDASSRDAINDAPPGSIQKTYTAVVAECLAPMFPDPMLCRSLNGNAQLVIDIRDSMTNDPWQSFMRFDTDTDLVGRTITKVSLRMVITAANNAAGPDTGSVFAVQPFTLQSLSGSVPAKVGGQLAGSQGAVDKGDVVTWTLPPSSVTGGVPVYLGLYANDDDGVNYFNRDGATPPRLIIDAQ